MTSKNEQRFKKSKIQSTAHLQLLHQSENITCLQKGKDKLFGLLECPG